MKINPHWREDARFSLIGCSAVVVVAVVVGLLTDANVATLVFIAGIVVVGFLRLLTLPEERRKGSK